MDQLSAPALEEGDVEERGVVVDELEDEHLERQTVLVLRVSATVLCKSTHALYIYFYIINHQRTSD